jgi:hypothetical protein
VSAEAKLRSTAPAGAKKRKVDSSVKLEFEQDIKKLDEWFERVESGLELLAGDEDQDSFTTEEQCVLIEVSKLSQVNTCDSGFDSGRCFGSLARRKVV